MSGLYGAMTRHDKTVGSGQLGAGQMGHRSKIGHFKRVKKQVRVNRVAGQIRLG